jgi:hypothetical protein
VGNSVGSAWGTTEVGDSQATHVAASLRLQSQRYERRIFVTAWTAQISWSLSEFSEKQYTTLSDTLLSKKKI